MQIFKIVLFLLLTDFESFKKEYCSSEKFEVRCPPDSLLLIHKALFGRMHAGRCVSAEYTHALGCHADVTNYVDTRCTAQQNCSMLVGMFDSISQPCPKDFNAYLEVTHQCIKGNITIVLFCRPMDMWMHIPSKSGLTFGMCAENAHPPNEQWCIAVQSFLKCYCYVSECVIHSYVRHFVYS